MTVADVVSIVHVSSDCMLGSIDSIMMISEDKYIILIPHPLRVPPSHSLSSTR